LSTDAEKCGCEEREDGVAWGRSHSMTYDYGVWIVWEDLR
jgi:hypothetical protein